MCTCDFNQHSTLCIVVATYRHIKAVNVLATAVANNNMHIKFYLNKQL